jgi:hypothetical protein
MWTRNSWYAVARKATGRLSALPIVLGAAIALPILPSASAQDYMLEPAAVALVCNDNGARICVTKVHENRLATLVGPATEALKLLSKVPGGPTAVEELPDPQALNGKLPVPAGVVPIDFDDWDLASGSGVTTDPDRLRLYLLAGAGTRSCLPGSYSDERERAARTVAAAWLTGELKPLKPLKPTVT